MHNACDKEVWEFVITGSPQSYLVRFTFTTIDSGLNVDLTSTEFMSQI